jgi:DNA mismatch repair protein MutH
VQAPQTIDELQARLTALAGRSIAEIANHLAMQMPLDLKTNKGWVGQLLELALGTTAGNRSAPDFEALGIELKTIPINAKGQPSESTYVCVAPLQNIHAVTWQQSAVRHKLLKVLWLPIEADKTIPLGQRRIGQGFIWSMPDAIEHALKQDFDEFIERIALGEVEAITADQGEYLQIRPKAANAKATTVGVGDEGQAIKTLPRGFYLRPSFTRKILQDYRLGKHQN